MVGKSVIALALAIVLAAVMPAAGRARAAGTLQAHAILHTTWHVADCPAGSSASALCYAVHGQGVVPGLGQTTELYTLIVDNFSPDPTTVHFTAAITVVGKGTIDASALLHSTWCGCEASSTSFPFTVTGGTGAYSGIQGSGTVVHEQYKTGAGKGAGTDTWSGPLTVAGYTFDTTPPVISGAKPKSVTAPAGAKRMRVRFKLAARDPGEGSVPVICKPRSGSRFGLGRTPVRCTATDANGNTAKARFLVTVKQA
jgi:hypothetical protein